MAGVFVELSADCSCMPILLQCSRNCFRAYHWHLIRSIPNWPLVSGDAYGGLPDNEIIYAQSMLCFTMGLHEFNRTVGSALQHNRPAVYVNAIAPKQQQALSGVVAGLNGIYLSESSTMQQPITTLGGEQFTVFAKTAKWADDLYSKLVAPALRSSLWAETWIRGYAVGPVCSGSYSVVDVTGVSFGGQTWTETQDHSKVRAAYCSVVCARSGCLRLFMPLRHLSLHLHLLVFAVGGGDALLGDLLVVHRRHQPHDLPAEAGGGHGVLPQQRHVGNLLWCSDWPRLVPLPGPARLSSSC